MVDAHAGGTGQAETLLAPVVITASRIGQDLWQSPATIDSIDGAQLREGQMQIHLSEGLARVPGLVVQNRQNQAQDLQISVRGFGARSTFGVRGLRLYVDGIPASAPDGQGQAANFPIGSAARIDVVRGPPRCCTGTVPGARCSSTPKRVRNPGSGAVAWLWGRTDFGDFQPSCKVA